MNQKSVASGIIRPALPADLPQILEIENLCFDKKWERRQFPTGLKGHLFSV